MRVSGDYIYDREVAVVGYGPVEALQDYNRNPFGHVSHLLLKNPYLRKPERTLSRSLFLK
jgi:hypothetical protein